MEQYQLALTTANFTLHGFIQKNIAAQDFPNKIFVIQMVCTQTGAALGELQIVYLQHQGKLAAQITYILQPQAQGKGYATQAVKYCRDYLFETCEVQSVLAVISDTNRRAKLVAIRAGMYCMQQMTCEDLNEQEKKKLYFITKREWLRATQRPGASEGWDLVDFHKNPLHRTILRRVRIPEGAYHLTVRVVVTDGLGNILLVHSAKKKKQEQDSWECPGGAVLSGETSLRAAQRELCEETGIALEQKEFVYVASATMGNCHHDIYLVCKQVEIPQLVFQPGETDCGKWVSFCEFNAMPEGRMPPPNVRKQLKKQFREKIGISILEKGSV